MKKNKKAKLSLDTETIKRLDDPALAQAVGGEVVTTNTTLCPATVGYTVCLCATKPGASCPCTVGNTNTCPR